MQQILNFIDYTCRLYHIDESHGLDHAIKTLFWSLKITKDVKMNYRECQIIKLSCLLHDMCDKKYMDEKKGIERIRKFLKTQNVDMDMIDQIVFIIITMSYSKVVTDGYPTFFDKSTEMCYHIVRNSDLLCSYDLERCIAFKVHCGGTRQEGILHMFDVFNKRVLRLIKDGYIDDFAKEYATELHNNAIIQLEKYEMFKLI